MRINLDKAEKLIGKIRVAEATLEKLYAEWDSLNAQPSKAVAPKSPGNRSRGGRKPQADSLTGKVVALLDGEPSSSFTPEGAAIQLGTGDVAAVRRVLDKQVFKGNIERRGRGEYGARTPEAESVKEFKLEQTA